MRLTEKEKTQIKRYIKNAKYLFIDFETRSYLDIKKYGDWVYSKHDSTDIISTAFSFDNSKSIFFTIDKNDLKILNRYKGYIVAHNYKFEYAIFINQLVNKGILNNDYINLERYLCTMTTALRCALSGSLDKVSRLLNIQNAKLDIGKKLINKYSKPKKQKKGVFGFREITDEDLKLLKEYNIYDIKSMQEIFNILPKLHEENFEKNVFELDKKMNDRGVPVDLKNVKRLIDVYNKKIDEAIEKGKKLVGETEAGGPVLRSTQVLLPIINDNLKKLNIKPIDNCQKETLDDLLNKLDRLKNNKIKEKLIKIIKLRRVLTASSTKKLYKFLYQTDLDGRARNQLQYAGAHTLRWAGRGIQIQNFPRSSVDNFEKTLDLLENDKISLYDSSDTINKMLRQCIKHKTKTFLIGDFAQIEARVLFWLSNCQKGLNVFLNGLDLYKDLATDIFSKPYESITTEQRFIGKTGILGLGYGTGAEKFYTLCKSFGLNIDKNFAETVKNTYRYKYNEVVQFWYKVDELFRAALLNKNQVFSYDRLQFFYSGVSLKIKLPSGRLMYYFRPYINKKNEIKVLLAPKKNIWGGLLVENIIQAISRDLLVEALLECERQSLNPIATVHDEIFLEINKSQAKSKLKLFKKILTTAPSWAKGLPLDAECGRSDRYCKM